MLAQTQGSRLGRGADSFRQPEGIPAGRFRQQRYEFLTPNSAEQVLRPQLPNCKSAKRDDDFIANFVSKLVVDSLKTIEVEHDESGRLAGKACPHQ